MTPKRYEFGGSRGQHAEILAAADLIARGYEVFTPALGYPASCDLIAVKYGQCVRVEVKTAHWENGPSGERLIGGLPREGTAHRFDLLARVTESGVFYTPSLDP